VHHVEEFLRRRVTQEQAFQRKHHDVDQCGEHREELRYGVHGERYDGGARLVRGIAIRPSGRMLVRSVWINDLLGPMGLDHELRSAFHVDGAC
jgi:hypothetical protein